MTKDHSFILSLLLSCSLLDAQFLPDGVSKQHPKLMHVSDDENVVVYNEYICVLNSPGSFHTENFPELESVMSMAEEEEIVVMNEYRLGIQGFSITNVTDFGMRRLLDQPEVAFCEQNQVVTAHVDSIMGKQSNPKSWGLDRIDQKKPELDGEYGFGKNYGTGTCVYILDTGIVSQHEDWGGRSIECVYDPSNSNCNDVQGHGTHVAGTACGVISGVAKNAKCMAAKVLSDRGTGTKAGVMNGMEAVARHAKRNFKDPCVVNMSLGGGKSQAENDLLNELSKDLLFVVSAGNSNSDACNASPASAEGALTVGATGISSATGKDVRAPFSSWGKCVDIFAPGMDIVSASNRGGYRALRGTSMASPHVTGAAALLLGTKSGLTVEKTKELILKFARQGEIEDVDNLPGPTPNLMLSTEKIIKKGGLCAEKEGFCTDDSACCQGTCQENHCLPVS